MTCFPLSARFPSPPVRNGLRMLACKSAEAASLSAETGEFEGYASLFGQMDLGRDVVLPGAFRDSLTTRGSSGIRLLWQHDPHQPLGRWAEITEDARGLYVRGQLDLGNTKAREAFSLMQRGALDGLSIGYRTQIERKDPATGLRALARIDLWEISLVTFPLLPQARVHGFRKRAVSRPGAGLTGSRLPAA
jgi:HK97 family phage prohead protease